VVKKVSERPMRGRRVVDICRVTRRKMPTQILMGPEFSVPDPLSIFMRKPVPKRTEMSQVAMTRKPKKGWDSDDYEKTQSTGANPRGRAPVRASAEARP
jgi:hypothetical protein